MLRVVKTKQVTYAVLMHLSEYVKSLGSAGLLESKETIHLHDTVQVDFLPCVPDILIYEHMNDNYNENIKSFIIASFIQVLSVGN